MVNSSATIFILLRIRLTYPSGTYFLYLRSEMKPACLHTSTIPWKEKAELFMQPRVQLFISYILRFSHQKFCFVKKRFGFYFDQSERRNEFLTREKIVSSNHKPRFKRIVFSRAFSRSSRRVALSGSFDKILYFRCTRGFRNSNFQVIKS